MLIYFYGPDSYRRTQALNEVVVKTFVHKHATSSVGRFYLDEDSAWDKLTTFVSSGSLFGDKKLAILYSPEKAPDSLRALLKDNADGKNLTLVVVADKKLPKEFGFLLKKPVTQKEFELLSGKRLADYIFDQISQQGLALSAAQVGQLIALYGSDIWAVMTEAQKVQAGAVLESARSLPDFFPSVQAMRASGSVGGRLKALHYIVAHYEASFAFNLAAGFAPVSQKGRYADLDLMIKTGKLEYPETLLSIVLMS